MRINLEIKCQSYLFKNIMLHMSWNLFNKSLFVAVANGLGVLNFCNLNIRLFFGKIMMTQYDYICNRCIFVAVFMQQKWVPYLGVINVRLSSLSGANVLIVNKIYNLRFVLFLLLLILTIILTNFVLLTLNFAPCLWLVIER